jgi:hypothetical protein
LTIKEYDIYLAPDIDLCMQERIMQKTLLFTISPCVKGFVEKAVEFKKERVWAEY